MTVGAVENAVPRRRANALVEAVGRIVRDEGFALNPLKTRVQGRAGRQRLTGLVVNERPRVAHREYDALRALLHNAPATGLAAQLQHPSPVRNPRTIVEGRMAWVASHDPDRGARLAALLEQLPSTLTSTPP